MQQYAFGKKGKPRFKGKGWFNSVEGKTNTSGILWRENSVKWLGLELPAIINSDDKVIAYGLLLLFVPGSDKGQYRTFSTIAMHGTVVDQLTNFINIALSPDSRVGKRRILFSANWAALHVVSCQLIDINLKIC